MRLAPCWNFSTAALNRRRLGDPRHLPAGRLLAGRPVNTIAGRRMSGVPLMNRAPHAKNLPATPPIRIDVGLPSREPFAAAPPPAEDAARAADRHVAAAIPASADHPALESHGNEWIVASRKSEPARGTRPPCVAKTLVRELNCYFYVPRGRACRASASNGASALAGTSLRC
jgi:hypothetical protein